MKKQELVRVALATFCALLAAGLSAYLFHQRDFLVDWDWAQAHGKVEENVDPRLVTAARDEAELKHPGEACAAKPVGRDEKYVYLAIGCAVFSQKLSETQMVPEDAGFVPTRLMFDGERVSSFEQPMAGARFNGLRRLFPKEVAEKLRFGFSLREFQKLGLARMAEKGQHP